MPANRLPLCCTDLLCLWTSKLAQNASILLRLELHYYHTEKFMKGGVWCFVVEVGAGLFLSIKR